MSGFDLLDRTADFAKSQGMMIFGVAMYKDGVIRERRVMPANDRNNVYSVAKAYTSAAVGLCVSEGLLDLTSSVYDVLRAKNGTVGGEGNKKDSCAQFASAEEDVPDLWKNITVSQVLSQTTGFSEMFLDTDADNVYSYGTDDWLSVVLRHPLKFKPGEVFSYTDANYYLLSRIVAAAADMPMQDYLRKKLFAPLRIGSYAFAQCPAGHAVGASGLFIRCADMAKLGALFLSGGVFGGKRYLSEEYVNLALSPHTRASVDEDYGYGFFIPRKHGGRFAVCHGMFGQAVIIDREREYVIAWQAHEKNRTVRGLFDFVYDN